MQFINPELSPFITISFAFRRPQCFCLLACDVTCHKKCEKNMPNLCGIDQKLLADVLHQLRKEKSMSAMNRQGKTPQ